MNTFLSENEMSALILSLKVSLVCAAASLPLALAAGMAFSRLRFRGKSLLEGIMHLPMVMPPVTTGYALLVILGTRGIVGQYLKQYFGIQVAFTWYAAVFASGIVAFPLFVRSIRTAMDMIDPKLEQAASTLGYGRLKVFFKVTLPLAWPGIFGGFLLAFARSMGEFGATVIFAGNISGETRTLPLSIYTAMQIPGGESQVFRLFLISAFASIICFCLSEFLMRRARPEWQRERKPA